MREIERIGANSALHPRNGRTVSVGYACARVTESGRLERACNDSRVGPGTRTCLSGEMATTEGLRAFSKAHPVLSPQYMRWWGPIWRMPWRSVLPSSRSIGAGLITR